MHKMRLLFGKFKLYNLLQVPVRFKGHGPDHWSVLKNKKTVMDRALEHFDDFYASIYGNLWLRIRDALLSKNHKYVAIVNNFSDTERIRRDLELLGAMNIKDIYDAHKNNSEMLEDKRIRKGSKRSENHIEEEEIIDKMSQMHSIYPSDYKAPVATLSESHSDEFDEDGFLKLNSSPLTPTQLRSIDVESEDKEIASTRIIHPSGGISAAALYEYMPATKLKGFDDFVLESDYYNSYRKGADFQIHIEREDTLNFPEHLLLYVFDEDNYTKFPAPKKGSTGVRDYFVLDGASILPVLALDLQPGDALLDTCAAPGGKVMTALQTLIPRLIVANDVQLSRINRIRDFFNQFTANINSWDDKFYVTQSDAQYINDKNIYNKILVDVPCTTDRHSLHEEDNNIFKVSRIKERLRLPELQTSLLANALNLVKVGGTVVYSTCSLSPIQNDGVVQMALKKTWEETNSAFVVKDQREALKPLECLYEFAHNSAKYGHVVVPTLENNWGPMYFCKMVRIQ